MSAIEIRHASADERTGVVRSQWWSALMPRGGAAYPATGRRGVHVAKPTARRMVELYVDDVLDDLGTTVLVATLVDAPGEILGWIVYDERDLHFVRVLSPYGRRGIGRSLLLQAPEGLEPQWMAPGSLDLLVAAAKARAQAA